MEWLQILSRKVMNRAVSQFGVVSIETFFLLAAIGIGIYLICLLIYAKAFKKEVRMQSVFAWLCMIIYVDIMLQLTLLGRDSGSRIGVQLSLHRRSWSDMSDYAMMMRSYSLLNVFLFIPYTFIFVIFPKIDVLPGWLKIIACTLVAFATSLSIEVIQLVTQRGYFEVDDLLCNSIGGLIGTLLGLIVMSIVHKINQRNDYEYFE